MHEARGPAPASIEKKLSPAGIRLLSLELIGELPRDLILSDNIKRTVKTTATTNVSLNLNLSEIRIALQPGIHIDTPIGQARLDALGLVFGESYPRLVTKDVGSGLNIHGLIFKTLMEDYRGALRVSEFSRPRYDWSRDSQLFDNIYQFYEMVTDPKEPRSEFTKNLKLDTLKLHGTLLREVRAGEEGTFISMSPGSNIDVTINFQAYLDNLIDAFKVSRQALVDTVLLTNIEIECSLRLFHEGQEIGRIESMEITRDGLVLIRDFKIIHPKAAGLELMINAGSVAMAVSGVSSPRD